MELTGQASTATCPATSTHYLSPACGQGTHQAPPAHSGGVEGAVPRQDEALRCCLREQSTRVVPGAGKMIREQEHRVPERSLTFTNHGVWWGGKDGSRLAAGLRHTAGTTQQVPLRCQAGHAACLQPPGRGAGQGAGAGVRTPALAGTWHWEGSAEGWTDRQTAEVGNEACLSCLAAL